MYEDEEQPKMPAYDNILQAYHTLGAVLENHFAGQTPPPSSMQPPNKLGCIAAPTPPPIR